MRMHQVVRLKHRSLYPGERTRKFKLVDTRLQVSVNGYTTLRSMFRTLSSGLTLGSRKTISPGTTTVISVPETQRSGNHQLVSNSRHSLAHSLQTELSFPTLIDDFRVDANTIVCSLYNKV